MDARPAAPLTTIIATIGPATGDAAAVGRLIDAGATAFRINFSHGDSASHARILGAIREAAAARGEPVAVIGDLPGTKIRLTELARPVDVRAGDTVTFTRTPGSAAPGTLSFSSTFPRLVDDARPGHRLLIDDGAVRMLVIDATPDAIACRVTTGGTLRSGKGINLPDTDESGEAVTAADQAGAAWAIEHDLDFLAQSYVGCADDVFQLREVVERCAAKRGSGLRPGIIAKIERPRAIDEAEPIIDAADAVMVARGDLGVEVDLARVPVLQKELTGIAARAGKPCIVATQMLQSMIEAPAPTRAEASDVAGAIFDQVDAVMLSGETAVGKHPTGSVEAMRRIALEAERYVASLPQRHAAPAKLAASGYRTAALAHGAWTTAQDFKPRLVIVWSQAGGGARYLSQNRFQVPIVAVSSDLRALRQMQLLRGVWPVHMERPADLAEFTRRADAHLVRAGWASAGDPCILMAGQPLGQAGSTNLIALHWVGNPASGFNAPPGPGRLRTG
jgi:pyruvate kinase